MLRTWPRQVSRYPGRTEAPSAAATLLTLLHQLQETVHIDAFLDILATAACSKGDNEAIVRAASLLPPAQAVALIEHLIASHAATDLSACSDLLARSVAAQVAEHAADLSGAATALLEALPGDPARTPPHEPWRRSLAVEPGCLVDLFIALGQMNAALAEQAADYILAWPQTYEPDAVLVPAVLGLLKSTASQDLAARQRLRTVAMAHLRARIAEALEPPRDWTRASTIACPCAHCRELSHFLADPERQSWAFKAPEAGRRHLEESIRRSGCDLDLVTDRRGRPYSLVCTKNQASYNRRAQQRQRDLAHLAQLEAPPERMH
jgi:hypothetical protein